ncbi:MAG: dipeptidase [Pyrinomonadaceae bacterium MAG19_C2-C3]|nr:dipeptidase [Pyrinomonadaceae bacterium MAG19_C2-C3]
MPANRIAEHVEANRTRFLDELKNLIAIPSVSTLPEHDADVRRAADFLVGQLREQVGMPRVELIETAGHPLVYAEAMDVPGKPTVLIYGHYDVQPADPFELWRTPPFEPTVDGDDVRGRGAVDDKGPMFATLKALETLMQTEGKLPVNVRVLIEGEEESGGASIAEYVKSHGGALQADCVLVLDTAMIEKNMPTISYGLRGIVYAEIIARGAGHDLHSGVYGGIAPNPLQALAWVLSDLKGRDGRINLPELYKMMQPLTDDERAALARQSELQEAGFLTAGGLKELPGEANYSIAERASARPTFEVHGVCGGFTGEGAKTVIPAEATAKVSLRLVPNQTPDAVFKLLAKRVAELSVPGVTMEVRDLHGGDAVLLSLESSALKAAATALETEFGKSVTYAREGGSIPVVALFDEVLHAPVVMLGFGLPDDNLHAPNEKFYIPNYYAAIRTVANFLTLL